MVIYMVHAQIGLCTIDLSLPEVHSLKQKRSILKSIIHRMQNKFNVAVAEIDHQDRWQSATLSFVTVSNTNRHVQQIITQVNNWIQVQESEFIITNISIEFL